MTAGRSKLSRRLELPRSSATGSDVVMYNVIDTCKNEQPLTDAGWWVLTNWKCETWAMSALPSRQMFSLPVQIAGL